MTPQRRRGPTPMMMLELRRPTPMSPDLLHRPKLMMMPEMVVSLGRLTPLVEPDSEDRSPGR